ncbi:unnamed protein product [Chrysoparadoxa australica]
MTEEETERAERLAAFSIRRSVYNFIRRGSDLDLEGGPADKLRIKLKAYNFDVPAEVLDLAEHVHSLVELYKPIKLIPQLSEFCHLLGSEGKHFFETFWGNEFCTHVLEQQARWGWHDAVAIGEALWEAGLVHHVAAWDVKFSPDKDALYRFTTASVISTTLENFPRTARTRLKVIDQRRLLAYLSVSYVAGFTPRELAVLLICHHDPAEPAIRQTMIPTELQSGVEVQHNLAVADVSAKHGSNMSKLKETVARVIKKADPWATKKEKAKRVRETAQACVLEGGRRKGLQERAKVSGG